ncbi:TetR/AcrR family transcriptional regulator [Pseudonocardia sp. C8]|uniref:TetR/AcrR family transcriptional regulator n=1 Tax=Pseudonocardia sp. C8 TaxID=2762759 RepID=UPI001643032B|nr:TetR/AcrR family transcriptional regulator [Pseudonocardia sp. C8]MBC3194473.1 TetR/AcrR family transcriptional regulator [Pseudonocardia sp. C8]
MAPSASAPRRRLPAEEREKQVLDAAVRVFSRIGFHDASMDDVAEQAGVSKPMVYTHGGGSKEELLRRCIRRESDRLLRSVSGAAGGPVVGAEERLRRGLRAFFTTLTTHRDGWSVLYRQARTGTFADEVHAARSRIVERVAELLADELDVPPGTDPLAVTGPVAAALAGAAEGLADWSGGAGGPDDPDVLTEALLTLVWPGLERLRRGG